MPFRAAQAAVAAEQQGKFWQYHDRLFAASDLSVNALKEMAAAVGLKQDEFNQALDSGATRAAVEKDIQDARQLGVRGTPTFLINGRIVRGAATLATLQGAIDRALTRPAGEELLETPAVNDNSSCQDSGGAAQGSLIKVAFTQDVRAATNLTTTDGVTLSAASINFSYQLVGTTSNQIVETVTNSGNTSLVITDISVSGHDRRDFIPAYSFSLPVTVAPGNSIAINLSFAPALPWRAGTRNARLEIAERRNSQYVALTGIGATCGGPVPACSSGCADADGDGLNDAWEIAGGIDINNDGLIDAQHDVLLPGADPNKADVYVEYDYMMPDPLSIGGACTTVSDCPVAPNQSCCDGVCSTDCHNPAVQGAATPGHAAFDQQVIQAFANMGVVLHIDPVHHALPHSKVVSWRTPVAACEGADVLPGTLGAYAVNYFDLKEAYFDLKRTIAYH